MVKFILCLGGMAVAFATNAVADEQALRGVFNTGPSLNEAALGSSLDVQFHACADDAAKVCATVIGFHEPNGPSGETTLPDGSLIIGYTIVTGLKAKKHGKYRGGNILAVDESVIEGEMNWYGLRVDNNFDGTLTASGCLGFICPRKMTWTEVASEATVAQHP